MNDSTKHIESALRGAVLFAGSIGITLLLWWLFKDYIVQFGNEIFKQGKFDKLELEWSQNMLVWIKEHILYLPVIAIITETIYNIFVVFNGDIKMFKCIVSVFAGFLASVFVIFVAYIIAYLASFVYVLIVVAIIGVIAFFKLLFD